MLRTAIRAALLTAVAGGLACTQAVDTSLLHIPPPDSWVEDLAIARDDRDAYFGTSAETPLLAEDREGFDGLDYWEPDPDYYLVGSVRFYAEPEELTLATTAGEFRPCQRIGWISGVIKDQAFKLQVYRLLDVRPGPQSTGFFLPFTDNTSGTETYPAGRYLSIEGPPGGPYVVDFNTAYNPSCAYGEPSRFACPVTPPENRLQIPIEAGERGFKEGA